MDERGIEGLQKSRSQERISTFALFSGDADLDSVDSPVRGIRLSRTQGWVLMHHGYTTRYLAQRPHGLSQAKWSNPIVLVLHAASRSFSSISSPF